MIRNNLARTALGLALAFAAPAFAQAPAPAARPAAPAAPATPLAPSHLEIARDLVEVTGLTQSFDSIYVEFSERARQIVGPARPEMHKDMNAVIESLKAVADKKRDEMVNTSATIFARRMSEADLKEVVGFFRSPVGQRYNLLRTQAIDEIFNFLQPWSVQTSDLLFDSFTTEMKKRGHQI